MKSRRNIIGLILVLVLLNSCQTTKTVQTGQEPIRVNPVDVQTSFINQQAISPQALDVSSGNLFANGGFESDLEGWIACSAGAIKASGDVFEDSGALEVLPDNCFYRSAEVSSGQDLVLSCYVKVLSGSGWTGMGMGFADSSWTTVSEAPTVVISGTKYARYDVRATTPANTKYASMWLYSENPTVVDNCTLMLESEPPTPPTPSGSNLLENGGFETLDIANNPTEWSQDCGGSWNVSSEFSNELNIIGGACVDQGLSAGDVAALSGQDYTYSCYASNNGGYASLSIFFDDVPTTKEIPLGQYQLIELKGTAPQVSSGFVSIYSEANLVIDNCSLTTDEDEPPPALTDNFLENGNFTGTDGSQPMSWSVGCGNIASILNNELSISEGTCVDQVLAATEVSALQGSDYTLQCFGTKSSGYAALSILFDGAPVSQLISVGDFGAIEVTGTAPVNFNNATVSIYAEGALVIDKCSLIANNAINPIVDDLIISEVSASFRNNRDFQWVEVYNPTSEVINLSDYKFRGLSRQNGSVTLFDIPSLLVEPASYAVIVTKTNNNVAPGPDHIYIGEPNSVPYWQSDGFVELVKDGATIDVVRFGFDSNGPLDSSAWQGESVVPLPSQAGNTFVRDLSFTDTNTASDWILVKFPTAGGANDVPGGAVDNDVDGIPDSAEIPGGTYAGMNLYSQGARTNQRDIFIEIDYMDSTNEGINPRSEALNKVAEVFARRGIVIHFEVDDVVPFANGITFLSGQDETAGFYEYKSLYSDLNRRNIYHYMLFGCSNNPTCTNANTGGQAEILGNDSMILLGSANLNSRTQTNLNLLINYQANTVMHELGHNLGLLHGGNEGRNYKPNYYSIMNYLYVNIGLPNPTGTGTSVSDRYKFYWGFSSRNVCLLESSPCESNYIIDYSDGTGNPIDENSINELGGVGRDNTWVDYDNSGTVNTPSFDANNDRTISVLYDHDDWGNLILPFQQYSQGILDINLIKAGELINPMDDNSGNWID